MSAVTDDADSPRDAEIVRQIVAGNVNAFEHLVDRYQNLVLAIVKKHVPFEHVEDTVQDVFLRTYRSLSTFKNDNGFKPWVSVIAVRTCHDFWRDHYKTREISMSSLTEQHQAWIEATLSDQSSRSFHETKVQNEAREVLDWALNKLSAAERMVLELIYFEGNSVKEAAHLLGLSIANVKVRLFRSRKKLHEMLTEAAKSRRNDV
ncbi:MAG: sigma-70 family RNA polymerase sigma factor [Syntrophobacterales bacterium]|nr:sigma-70 family RNA polymerase sigma factor [Syntrophobacterales bacterium]